MEGVGLSGKTQLRDLGTIGHVWSESYPPLLVHAKSVALAATAQAVQGWLAFLEQAKARGTIFTLAHPQRQTLFGAGVGAPLVAGASQTGASLVTDGWTDGHNPQLKAGDIFTLAGLNPVFVLTADAPNTAAGATTLAIEPPIPAGSSPADDAALTINATPGSVLFRARLVAIQKPDISTVEYLVNLTLTFAEMP
jgi:hypothetical protein